MLIEGAVPNVALESILARFLFKQQITQDVMKALHTFQLKSGMVTATRLEPCANHARLQPPVIACNRWAPTTRIWRVPPGPRSTVR